MAGDSRYAARGHSPPRMRQRLRLAAAVPVALAVAAVGAVAADGAAQQRPQAASAAGDLRRFVPDDAVAVLEAAAPGAAIAALRTAIGGVPDELPLQARLPLAAGLVAVWAAVGGDPERWADRLAGGGALAAWVPAGGGVRPFAVLRPNAPAAARDWLRERAPRLAVVPVGDLLVVAGDAALAARITARGDGEGDAGRWRTVDLGPAAAVRGAVDLTALRRAVGARPWERLDGGQRFVLAPILHALAHAPWLQLAVDGGERLTVRAVGLESLRGAPGEAWLARPDRACPVPLAPDGVARLRLDRSLQRLLEAPEALLPEDGVQAVRGFLAIADALDGAHTSFVDDVLGGLGEPFELHVLPVDRGGDAEADERTAPGVRLPGLALVAPLRDPRAEPILFRAAQAIVLIANAERAQRGQLPFTARFERSEHGGGLVATPAPWRGAGAPPLDHALSPTLWSEAGVVVLASTRAAAHAVVAQARTAAAGGVGAAARGDLLVLRGAALAGALAANRRVAALARVLDEGEDVAAAERFVATVEGVLRAVREVTVRVDCETSTTRVELTLERAR
jgi:hypothetical protein